MSPRHRLEWIEFKEFSKQLYGGPFLITFTPQHCDAICHTVRPRPPNGKYEPHAIRFAASLSSKQAPSRSRLPRLRAFAKPASANRSASAPRLLLSIVSVAPM